VKAVYDDAHRELEEALAVAQTQRDGALQVLSHAHGGGERLVVWNLSFDDRPLSLRLSNSDLPDLDLANLALSAPDGGEVGTEVIGDELLVIGNVKVPGLGYLCLGIGAGQQPEGLQDSPEAMVLENEHLRAEIAPDGSLASLVYKHSGREALDGPGNQLWLYPDVPREWEGWELDASYPSGGERLLSVSAPERLPGRLEQAVRVRYDAQGSEVIQTYVLRRGSRRLEIRSAVKWRGRRLLLRAQTPLNVRAASASFETAFGTVARSTHSNTSWDAAQFEVPGHRFADLSEADFGVSLLTLSKYGYSAKGNVLGLSLLRGPLMPDPSADAGDHAFTYALYPHAGDWRNGTLPEAHDLNAPLRAFHSFTVGNSEAIQSARLLAVGHPALRLSALKLSEDDDRSVILRVYDGHGTRGHMKVEGLDVKNWSRVNLLEDPEAGELNFTPYTVLSLTSGPLDEPRE
jgi:alpha-mannosidase